jgi:hypothetical protein
MRTDLIVKIETDYTHDNEFQATRQRMEKAAFFIQSLFYLIKLANANFESITNTKEAENHIENLNNLCELGSGLAFSVFREASNFSLYKFNENKTVELETPKDYAEFNNVADEDLPIRIRETDELEADDLAEVLSQVLNNPNLPITLYNALQNAIAEVYTGGNNEVLNQFESSPEFLQAVIKSCQNDES